MDFIKPFIGNENAKVLIGIRRSGKSTILRMIADEILQQNPDANIIWIDFERLEFRHIQNLDSLYEYVKKRCRDDVGNYLFIDEVQDVDRWELTIRSLISERICEIFLTGSNSKLLSSEYTTYIGGRYNSMAVRPLSFSECISFLEERGVKSDIGDAFEKFVKIGGFPSLWLLDYPLDSAYSALTDIYTVIVSKDLVGRYGIRNIELLERIVKFLCDNIGKETSLNNVYEELSKEYGDVSRATVYDYVRFLENSFMFSRVNFDNIAGKKLLRPNYKFYLADIGLKHALLGYDKDDVSWHLENIVFLEMLNRGYRVTAGKIGDGEIDFIGDRRGERIYIQVTYMLSTNETVRREFGNLEAIPDQYPKYVVGQDPHWEDGHSVRGVIYRDVRAFLLDPGW